MNKQTDRDAQYLDVADAVARILHAEGFRGFFKGIQVCFLIFSAYGVSKVQRQQNEWGVQQDLSSGLSKHQCIRSSYLCYLLRQQLCQPCNVKK